MLDHERRFRGYTPSIVFEGRVHQYVGPLQAKEGEEPRFAQLFVHDPALEKTARVANMQMPATLSSGLSSTICLKSLTKGLICLRSSCRFSTIAFTNCLSSNDRVAGICILATRAVFSNAGS